jgi:sulfur carrier protein
MRIEIELFGQLLPDVQRRQMMDLEKRVYVYEVAHKLGLKPEEVGLIVMDGVQSEMGDLVYPGCRLCFFPPMSGG